VTKRILTVLAVALVMAALMAFTVAPAFAGLQTTTSHKNGGGNTPSGNANGVPTTTTTVTSGNGNAPPGQNK
jgi:multidrug efflux pump subunit AcrB